MKTNLLKSLLLVAAVLVAAIPLRAQVVSNNNEDEVNKVDQYAQQYRPGQVIVKFKESSPVNLKSTNGKLRSSGVSAVDKTLTTLGVTEAEQLMPLTGDIKNRTPRKAKSLTGRTITEQNLSKLYCLKFEENEERNVETAVEMLKSLGEVEYAEPNYMVFIQSSGSNSLYIDNFYIQAGQSKEVSVMLENDVIFSALQVDIYLPQGLSIAKDADDDYIVALTNRKGSDHTISTRLQSSGAIRVLISSPTNQNLSGYSGALFTFQLVADASYSGTSAINLGNIVASTAQQDRYPLDDMVCQVTEGEPEGTEYTHEPLYATQWYLNAIHMPQLWAMGRHDTQRPVIAILDTGVDITHPDLADNIWTNANEADGASYTDDDANGYVDDVHGWDFIAGTAIINNGMDRNGHGTHCAGIAAAVGNNDMGITGANPDALIMPIKVMNDDGTGDIATICRGIDYATACGANILSMSFGTGSPSAAMYQSLCNALTNYAVLVGAAGNNGATIYDRIKPGLVFPGAFDVVIGVMASAENGQRAGFSNFDPDGPFFSRYNMDKAFSSDVTWNDEAMWNYDVMAPGVGITSTYLNGSYKSLNGTSMATPLVAGAVSRILQAKGFDYARDYGLIGDMAMAKDGGLTDLAIFNAYQAAGYNETNRQVSLVLTALEIDDSEGDGDGHFDAGETISIWPTIRSLWGHAQNIKISIEPYDDNVPTDALAILDNNVDFGWSLNTRGSMRSQNPIRVRVNENANDGLHLPYKIVITSDNLLAAVEQNLVFEVENGVELWGVINEDLILYPDKHYIVTKNIAIPQGKTLTILPGTRLEFNDDCYIQSEGKIIANGTIEQPIVFTCRAGQDSWGGIRSHETSSGSLVNGNNYIYTNADSTLFTLSPTELTPIQFNSFTTYYWVPQDWSNPTTIQLDGYLPDFDDLKDRYGKIWLNDKQSLLTDTDFISEYAMQMMNDYKETIKGLSTTSIQGYKRINVTLKPGYHNKFNISNNPCDTLAYCILEKVRYINSYPRLYFKDCRISILRYNSYLLCTDGIRNNFINSHSDQLYYNQISRYALKYSNFVNFIVAQNNPTSLWSYGQLNSLNLINSGYSAYNWILKYFVGRDQGIFTDHAEWPSWLGSGNEDIIRPYIYDSMNPNVDCFTTVDLSNMPTRPYANAHGIVWKVVVDGYDAQDEFNELPPLGVGRHEFKVYFNRPEMDQTSTPIITMGLRSPYTQTAIAEDGTWSVDDGVAVYTAYLNITGKTNADGLNRICVTGAKDNEFFEVPIEKTRFNVNVQAAGSMATGFAAEAGLGKVNLTWNNENNNFDDAMGFNVYRFQLTEAGDTINRVRVNETIIDLETEEYTDFNVTAGETYYYYYKVMSTDLKEYDISNVVAATPLTSIKGDANGSMSVNIADVVTIVSYLSQQDPQPFIFDAADVNEDGNINILDIVGVINIIAHPDASTTAMSDESVIYTISDGILYVDTPVALGGVQVTVDAPAGAEITTLEALDGMERTWIQLDENHRMLLSYSMSGKSIPAGKTALLDLNGHYLTDIVVSDTRGNELMITNGEIVTSINDVEVNRTVETGIYDLMGRKISSRASDLDRLPHGIYIVNGVKVVK